MTRPYTGRRAAQSGVSLTRAATLTRSKPRLYPILTLASLNGAMFETNLANPAAAIVAHDATYGADGLRPLSWAELVARLSAARDFRRVMGSRFATSGASFNQVSARHLAALGDAQRGINPFALANGKIANGMELAGAGDDMQGDRGRP